MSELSQLMSKFIRIEETGLPRYDKAHADYKDRDKILTGVKVLSIYGSHNKLSATLRLEDAKKYLNELLEQIEEELHASRGC